MTTVDVLFGSFISWNVGASRQLFSVTKAFFRRQCDRNGPNGTFKGHGQHRGVSHGGADVFIGDEGPTTHGYDLYEQGFVASSQIPVDSTAHVLRLSNMMNNMS